MSAGRDIPVFRDATAHDAPAIARLHAASWRAHYRGALGDAYLDGPIEAERLGIWTERLRTPEPSLTVIVAEEGGELLGFVCAVANEHDEFGSLVDNLHVAIARKAGGIGRTPMGHVADRLALAAPGRPVHLFVKQMNVGARAFYARIGGATDGKEVHTGIDGSRSDVLRILWSSPAALRQGTSPP